MKWSVCLLEDGVRVKAGGQVFEPAPTVIGEVEGATKGEAIAAAAAQFPQWRGRRVGAANLLILPKLPLPEPPNK